MASLNTLRTKGGVVVSIIIGISLIAFLLGDLTSSGSRLLGKSQTRVGEIAGNSIDYTEYQQEAEYTTRVAQIMAGTENLSAEQTDQTRNMAWDALILKYSYLPGFETMGIAVGEGEQIDMVNGVYLSPVIESSFKNQSTGVYDPELLRNFNANIDSDPNAAIMWSYMKKQMVSQRVMEKYMALLTYGMFTNNLEVEQGVKDANSTYAVRYVTQNYSSIADSLVTVTDAQIKSYYNDHKKMFHQSESRGVEYVVFDMVPSQDDYAQAQQYMSTLKSEFVASADPMQYAVANSRKTPDKRFVRADALDPLMTQVIMEGDKTAIYGPVLNGTTYTMTRLAAMRSMSDSLGARQITLDPKDTVLADSLVNVLRKGGDFIAIAAQYSLDKQTPGGDMGIFTPDNMLPEISEACLKANKGDYFAVPSAYGLFIINLTYKTTPVQKVQVATITYDVKASSVTEQAIYGQASAFLSTAAGSTEKFNNAVATSTINKRTARISNLDRNVNGVADSREMVRWAFTSKKGSVSNIMVVNSNYVVANLVEVSEEGIAPVKQASAMIRMILTQEAKAKMISDKMNGASIDAIASTIGVQVNTITDMQPSTFYIDGLGPEMQLIGAISSLAQGKISKPVEGSAGVFVFDITAINKLENATPESEKVRLEAMAQSYFTERINQALITESKIKDLRVKFF